MGLYGGGSPPKPDDTLQRESLKLQRESLEFAKKQALKLEEGIESKEAKAAAEKQKAIELNRTGRVSTIKTIERRTDFETFQKKFNEENPLGVDRDAIIAKAKAKAIVGAIPNKGDFTQRVFAGRTPVGSTDDPPVREIFKDKFDEKKYREAEEKFLADNPGFKRRGSFAALFGGKKGEIIDRRGSKEYAEAKSKATKARNAKAKTIYGAMPGITRKVVGKQSSAKRKLKAGGS